MISEDEWTLDDLIKDLTQMREHCGGDRICYIKESLTDDFTRLEMVAEEELDDGTRICLLYGENSWSF